jgi:cytochrome P450
LKKRKKGIFAVDGVLWKKQKQIASPLFSIKELRYMVPVFIEHGKIVLKILEEASNNPNESFDLQNLFQRFTLDAILKVINN